MSESSTLTTAHESALQAAPDRPRKILRMIGPGLIITASVVGSGELIGTTKTGAQAGITLLWLIAIGCVVKTPTLLYLGHYCLSSGKGTIAMLNEVPGPRLRVGWVVWFWLIVQITSIGQLGGIAHGVGQTLALSFPLLGDCRELASAQLQWDFEAAKVGVAAMTAPRPSGVTYDDILWSIIACVSCVLLLLRGGYRTIEWGSTAMVVIFTVITVFCVGAVQLQPEWRLRPSDIAHGLSFSLPSTPGAITTGLATLGIIGLGANELVGWIYWLKERGYSRFTGPHSADPAWATRAQGWMRVMRWDAGVSMCVYTFATLAFFVLGATVLFRQGLDPAGHQMIQTLAQMYVPIFGQSAQALFFIGSFMVLYSTLFVATATHARVTADACLLFAGREATDEALTRWSKPLVVILSVIACVFLAIFRQPVMLILFSGLAQAAFLPILAGSAIYFRWWRADKRIGHGKILDGLLVLTFLLLVGSTIGIILVTF